jgi:uncharacterized protein (TIGR02265 family)
LIPNDEMSDLTVDLGEGFQRLEVERRVADTPPTAHVRGLFFRLAEQAVSERSAELLATWRAASGARSRWPFKLYSTREFIREQAVAAVLLDPADPGAELRKMWSSTPKFSSVIRAEGFIRYLTGRSPERALAWLGQNRKMMCDYGAWRVELEGNKQAVFHYEDEYTWIGHAHLGGVEGTLRRCGVTPVVTVDLDSAYCGRLLIRWD